MIGSGLGNNMAELNKYSLYNYNFQISFDKSAEIIQMLEKSTYNEVLNYIVDKYGDFTGNVKFLNFPEVSKSLNIKLDKSSNKLDIELLKDGEIITEYCLQTFQL